MTEKKIRCDACDCGKDALPVDYNYRREMDAAGSMETNHNTVDLCHSHMQQELQKLLKTSNTGTEKFNLWANSQKYKVLK